MGDRTKADISMIKGCSRDLTKIHREFDQHGNPADGYADALGHSGVQDSFHEFGTTWKKTRKHLMKEIKKLADMTAVAAEKYEEIDHELANAIRGAKSKGEK
ncbi:MULTISPECIES: hypothetical protein [unclassified Streptomyces]|uniref:hypothetical protein n=1 Tax=unclassified Streptomyces TaxID=2593676 RepID=UPI002DD9BC90|nr:hypothetical protein [Streptomyces sp. NBC_01766]WSC20606.1 hypothetical protein OIE60_13410 [Streptomyces sp. NBC_01766]WSV54635.1 hypothetical protein OG282_13465 [Streptomyces sp. NBC_01014]